MNEKTNPPSYKFWLYWFVWTRWGHYPQMQTLFGVYLLVRDVQTSSMKIHRKQKLLFDYVNSLCRQFAKLFKQTV